MAARKKMFTPEEVIAFFRGDVSSSEDELEAEETFSEFIGVDHARFEEETESSDEIIAAVPPARELHTYQQPSNVVQPPKTFVKSMGDSPDGERETAEVDEELPSTARESEKAEKDEDLPSTATESEKAEEDEELPSTATESEKAEEDEESPSTAAEPQLLNRAEEPPPVFIDPFAPSDTSDGSGSEANADEVSSGSDKVSSGSSADLDDVSESDTPQERGRGRGRG